MKEISCGFIILNKKNTNQILACHAYGHKFDIGQCDIPKGHVEGYESHLAAAKRELKEETGLIITTEPIHDCGLFKYSANKDLHLYLIEADVNLNKLHCDSMFVNKHGDEVPEMIGYHWVSDTNMFYNTLGQIIKSCIEHYKQWDF